MRYAKLVDGNPVYATNPLRIGTRHIYTTDPTKYGYKPVNDTPPQCDEGYHAEPVGWEETEDAITRTWTVVADSFPSEDNIPKGAIFESGGVYYRALSAIPRGDSVIEGTNATPIDVAAILNQLEIKE